MDNLDIPIVQGVPVKACTEANGNLVTMYANA